MLRLVLLASVLAGCATSLDSVPKPPDLVAGAQDSGAATADLAGLPIPDFALPLCISDKGMTATVDGTTPLGAFHGRYAWAEFLFDCGCTGLVELSITQTDHFGPWPDPRLVMLLDRQMKPGTVMVQAAVTGA